jgi:hypothetical protein
MNHKYRVEAVAPTGGKEENKYVLGLLMGHCACAFETLKREEKNV